MQRGLGGFPHERLHQDNDFNACEKLDKKSIYPIEKKVRWGTPELWLSKT